MNIVECLLSKMPQVEELNKDIKASFNDLNRNLDLVNMSLLYYLAAVDHTKVISVKKTAKALLSHKEPQFNKYNWNITQISMLVARWKLLEEIRIDNKEDIESIIADKVSIDQLNRYAMLTTSPTTLLALKFYYICNYTGNHKCLERLPYTRQVKRSVEFLLGHSVKQDEYDKFNNDVAYHLGISNVDANSLFWIMGEQYCCTWNTYWTRKNRRYKIWSCVG